MIFLLNGFFGSMGFAQSIIWCSVSLVAVVAIDAAIAILTRLVPEKKINPFHKIFIPSDREREFYKKIGVRKWKDAIPETGKYLCNFAKDKVDDPNNNEYLIKFLRETCYAGVMHIISVFAGFFILFLPYRLTIALPIACVNALLQLPPFLVQRFNRPRLIFLYKFNQKHAKEATV